MMMVNKILMIAKMTISILIIIIIIIFRERMLVNTPISIYSVGSTISRRSSGIDSQYDSRQPQGTPPNWPNHYNKVNITYLECWYLLGYYCSVHCKQTTHHNKTCEDECYLHFILL